MERAMKSPLLADYPDYKVSIVLLLNISRTIYILSGYCNVRSANANCSIIRICPITMCRARRRSAQEYTLVPDLSTLAWERPLVANLGILARKCPLVAIFGQNSP